MGVSPSRVSFMFLKNIYSKAEGVKATDLDPEFPFWPPGIREHTPFCLLPSPSSAFLLSGMVRAAHNRRPRRQTSPRRISPVRTRSVPGYRFREATTNRVPATLCESQLD